HTGVLSVSFKHGGKPLSSSLEQAPEKARRFRFDRPQPQPREEVHDPPIIGRVPQVPVGVVGLPNPVALFHAPLGLSHQLASSWSGSSTYPPQSHSQYRPPPPICGPSGLYRRVRHTPFTWALEGQPQIQDAVTPAPPRLRGIRAGR